MLNQVVPNGNNLTVLSLAEAYTSLRAGVRSSTRAGYKTVLNVLRKDPFGSRRIDKVTFAEAKAWLARLQTVDGRGYSSIHSIRGVLRPAFRMAVENDWIRKNPFDFELATVVVNDSVTREALTRKQERRFLEFVKADRHYSRYYEGIFILFKTGLRISEFCVLTIADIDFGARRIRVERQLQRTSDMRYVIQAPKTEKGIRFVPMSDEVAECFRKVMRRLARRRTGYPSKHAWCTELGFTPFPTPHRDEKTGSYMRGSVLRSIGSRSRIYAVICTFAHI